MDAHTYTHTHAQRSYSRIGDDTEVNNRYIHTHSHTHAGAFQNRFVVG